MNCAKSCTASLALTRTIFAGLGSRIGFAAPDQLVVWHCLGLAFGSLCMIACKDLGWAKAHNRWMRQSYFEKQCLLRGNAPALQHKNAGHGPSPFQMPFLLGGALTAAAPVRKGHGFQMLGGTGLDWVTGVGRCCSFMYVLHVACVWLLRQ